MQKRERLIFKFGIWASVPFFALIALPVRNLRFLKAPEGLQITDYHMNFGYLDPGFCAYMPMSQSHSPFCFKYWENGFCD